MSARKAIFLDRDGTLIVDTYYPRDPALVAPVEGVFEAMHQFINAGYALVVISNQSGVARGKITPEEAKAVHERFIDLFSSEGISFTGSYYCPHDNGDGCDCRKPNPGMLLQAARDHDLDCARSFMMGDRLSDIEAGKNAGCRTVLFESEYVSGPTDVPDCVVTRWDDASSFVLKQEAGHDPG